MRSRLEIEVAAPPSLIFALVRDPERWPRLLPHYARARVVHVTADGVRTMEFIARRPVLDWLGLGLPVAWRARTWNDPSALTVDFRHSGGATDGLVVTWRIEPAGSGCRVSIEHDLRRGDGTYSRVLDRLFIRPIAGRTLATFKALAESLADLRPAAPAESAAPAPTNLPI
jgi:ribosome-associated toxin RatA of RatAB toxin-antitoxin module